MTYDEKVKALRALLETSILEATGDGKATALQLSGGLDSAIVQAVARLDRLYCCTWPEFDNLAAAERVACGKPVRPVTFTRSEMLEVALPVVARLTKGRGTWSQCCQWFMARDMATDGVQVELNGEGADELFGGYARYRILWWLDRMMLDPHLVEYQGTIERLLDVPRSCDGPFSLRVQFVVDMMADRGEEFSGRCDGALTDAVGWHDETHGLVELLGFEDKIAAARGIEHRHPFMAPAVVEFAHGLTEADKITAAESKHILRDVARSLGVHADCVDEVTKRGLVVPPTWAPGGAQKWSRGWFEKLMAEAWQRQQEVAA
jgi:asparagine synthase (glutamine-hydrolysing)